MCWTAKVSIGDIKSGQLTCLTPEQRTQANRLTEQILEEQARKKEETRKAELEKRAAAHEKEDAEARKQLNDTLNSTEREKQQADLATKQKQGQPKTEKKSDALIQIEAIANGEDPELALLRARSSNSSPKQGHALNPNLSNDVYRLTPPTPSKEVRVVAPSSSANRPMVTGFDMLPSPAFIPNTSIGRSGALAARQRLWSREDIGAGTIEANLNPEKLKYDWDTLNLSAAAYRDDLVKGAPAFKNRDDWIVEDIRKNPSTGFLAYAMRNDKSGRIVVAIQGSRPDIPGHPVDAFHDWIGQDAKAYVLQKTPQQFEDAALYVGQIKNKFGGQYVVDCTGHSLGGGACAYAASKIDDVRAVTLNPITSTDTTSKNSYLIDNYYAKNDVANFGATVIGRSSPGRNYRIEVPAPPAAPSGLAQSTPATVEPGLLRSHNLELLLDQLGAESGLSRYQLGE